MRFYYVMIAIILSGCSTNQLVGTNYSTKRNEVHVVHTEIDGAQMKTVCGPRALGCFRTGGGVCYVYTLPRWVYEARNELDTYHRVLGHEMDHCEVGFFHGVPKGAGMVPTFGRFF